MQFQEIINTGVRYKQYYIAIQGQLFSLPESISPHLSVWEPSSGGTFKVNFDIAVLK